jgi:hypothetical protein
MSVDIFALVVVVVVVLLAVVILRVGGVRALAAVVGARVC